MLEKIGLPPKPSLRGNTWVVDASHCQGCSSQFTFINRKHHCRRCGGIFCNSCTQQRMVLRGQGDSPVRICEPCKKLEEAARFELRYGHKNRVGRGSSKLASNNEDEILNQILGNEGKESLLGSSASCSSAQEVSTPDDEPDNLRSEIGSVSPEALRQKSLDEKKKYRILKGEGKAGEALKAFKRGKELERQADALEISIRKNRKRTSSSVRMDEIQSKDGVESGRKNKLHPHVSREKDDFTAELRELGLSDMDFHEDKKSTSVSLEGELSNILGEVSQRTNKSTSSHGIDKTEVIAIKKKALALKREGKLNEAKEELKKAKVLEKQLEEQELLAGAEDSDDELSALINSMDDDKSDIQLSRYDWEHSLDINNLTGIADDVALDSSFEATDDDMEDPEMAAALTSLGWTDDSDHPQNIASRSDYIDREALSNEILSLKREALYKKRAGNAAEAMALLKKAKLLEQDLESIETQTNVQKDSASRTAGLTLESTLDDGSVSAVKGLASKVAAKSRLSVQKELLALKKKALALRREGRLDEAEEELKKGRVLEQELEEMDNASKVKTTHVTAGSEGRDLAFEHPLISGNHPVEVREEDVTDQDLHDPTYLSLLRNLGWNDEDNESSVTQAVSDFPARKSRSKAEIQKELLGLKRKSLALRRQGKTDEAEEVLQAAKALEDEMAEMETPKIVASSRQRDKFAEPPLTTAASKEDEDVSEADMNDTALLSVLKGLEFKEEEKPAKQVIGSHVHASEPLVIQSSSCIPVKAKRSKGEIQRELLGLKRKALALRRKGEIEEAEEVLKMAKVLEAQMEELEVPSKEFLLDTSGLNNSLSSDSLITNQEKHGGPEDAVRCESSAETVSTNLKVAALVLSSERMDGDAAKNINNSSITSQLVEDHHPLLGELGFSGEMGTSQGTFMPGPAQSGSKMDLLTGEGWTSSQLQAGKLENKGKLGVVTSSLSMPALQSGLLTSSRTDIGGNDDVTTERREEKVVQVDNLHVVEPSLTRGLNSENDQSSLRQEVLACKRRAVNLKREGKLAEAREELRQAKLLEKSLGEDNAQSKTGLSGVSISTPAVPSVGQKEQHGAPNVAPKPLSGHERFKTQQESLSHKRQALKLRREGRVEEAEAELELAKALEAQLELAAHDSTKPSASAAEAIDGGIEDLLDPKLLSALQAIGIEDASISSRRPEKPKSVNVNTSKNENVSLERMQLEEQIKAEKVKAVGLKRSGKQAEALDALRRAKLYEKKLNSLPSN